MISAAFFVLLTLAVLGANKMILENTKFYLQEEAIEQGSNFANALLGEILTKKYDHNMQSREDSLPPPGDTSIAQVQTWMYNTHHLDSSNYYSPSHFQSVMGPPSAIYPWPDAAPYKSMSTYKDVGAYKGYQRTANSADISGYTLTVNVYYVTKSNDSTDTGIQTYYKRIDVSVTHPTYLTKPLTFSAIATY